MGRILISAGHTDVDPGAIFGDLRETDYTRKIAQNLILQLEKAGAEVKGVPLDLPLLKRIQWINNTGYTETASDICIEIHINDGGKRGLESWFEGEGNNDSQKLAKVLVEETANITGYENQGFKSEYQHELGSLTFLNRTNPSTVILETLYIDNPHDAKILQDESKLEELTSAIAKAILKFQSKDIYEADLPDTKKPSFNNLKPITPQVSSQIRNAFRNPQPVATNLPGFGNRSLGLSNTTPNNFMLDREQRKLMIQTSYKKILGRSPKQAELSYFLNQGTSETDLIKKMAESQEHLDILKSQKELKDKLNELTKLDKENLGMKAMIREQKALIDNLNRLINHKNQALASNKATPGEILSAAQHITIAEPEKIIVPVERSLIEKFFNLIIGKFG